MTVMIWLGSLLVASASKPLEPPSSGVAPDMTCPSSIGALPVTDADDSRLHGDHLVVIMKSARRIMRYHQGKLFYAKGAPACWNMGLGPNPIGHKQREGDGKTPEGWYRTSDKPWSQWYAAIAIHYPNKADANAAKLDGRIDASTAKSIMADLGQGKKPSQTSALGGEILIHGGGSASDWTLGCIAMDNPDIDALRAMLPATKVTDVLILP